MKWVIFIFAGTLYLYEYFIRVAPSVMVLELMQAFTVNATAIGALSGFFFYIYAPLQIPAGMLVDRYGARKLLTMSGVAAGLGTLLFGLSTHFWEAALGRFLMGAGSSFGFVGLIYICAHWFSPRKRGVMIGLGNTVGMFGAILGQGPLRLGLNVFGWRGTFILLALFGLFLGTLLFILVRDDPRQLAHDAKLREHDGTKLLKICKDSQTWLNALCALFFYVATATFGGLWGVPFIQTKYQAPIQNAGFAVSMIFFGWAVGGPLIGIYADRIRQKKAIIAFSSLIGFLLMAALVYATLPFFLVFALLFLIGIVSSAQLLNFSYAIDITSHSAKATATAFVNFIVVLGTAVMQPLVGVLLDLNWSGQTKAGVPVYSIETYSVAMTAFPACFLIAFLFSLFLKQKGHK